VLLPLPLLLLLLLLQLGSVACTAHAVTEPGAERRRPAAACCLSVRRRVCPHVASGVLQAVLLFSMQRNFIGPRPRP
jgi:hypothetical protein